MEERRYISSETAAQLIGITRRSVNRQIKGGRLQAVATPTTKGGAEGTANSILLEDVLQQLDTQGRLLWYESQSGLSTQVSAADLATYKEAFGEEGLTELANRQQAVMALDGILNSGERGRTAAMDALAGTLGVTSRTLRRWHAAYKERGLAAIMDKVERRDKGQSRTCCQLARDFIEAQMCDNRKFPQTLVLERLREPGCGIRRKRLQLLRVLRRIGRAAGAQTGRQGEIPHLHHGKRLDDDSGESSRGQPHRGNDGQSADDVRPLRQAGLGSGVHAENQAKQADDDQRSLVRRPSQDRPVCAGRE